MAEFTGTTFLEAHRGNRDYMEDAASGTRISEGSFQGLGRNKQEVETNFALNLANLYIKPPGSVDQRIVPMLYNKALPDYRGNPHILENLTNRIDALVQSGKLSGIRSLSDGMGGHGNGNVASGIGIWAYYEAVARQLEGGLSADATVSQNAIVYANEVVKSWNLLHRADSGATFIGALTDAQGNTHISYVGDSRAYRWDEGDKAPVQITSDQSQLWIAMMTGQVDPFNFQQYQDRNIIQQSLGDLRTPLKSASLTIPASEKPWFLVMCSDGVWEGIDVSKYGSKMQEFRRQYNQEKASQGPLKALQMAQGRILSLLADKKLLGIIPKRLKPPKMGAALVNDVIGAHSHDNMSAIGVQMMPISRVRPVEPAVPARVEQEISASLRDLLALTGRPELPRFNASTGVPLQYPRDEQLAQEQLKDLALTEWVGLFVNKTDAISNTSVQLPYSLLLLNQQYFPTFFNHLRNSSLPISKAEMDHLFRIFRDEAKLSAQDVGRGGEAMPEALPGLQASRRQEMQKLAALMGEDAIPRINLKTGAKLSESEDSMAILQAFRRKAASFGMQTFLRSNSIGPNVKKLFLAKSGRSLFKEHYPTLFEHLYSGGTVPIDFKEAGRVCAELQIEAEEWLREAGQLGLNFPKGRMAAVKELVSQNTGRDSEVIRL